MLKPRDELEVLRVANPIQLNDAAAHASALGLRQRVLDRCAGQEIELDQPIRADTGGHAARRLRAGGFVAVAAACLAVLLATPALGRLRDALPFWSAPKAPPSVSVEFSSMNTGAPAGMSPQAIPGDTRKIGDFQFGGGAHTLWVAPTKSGSFCFEWIGGWGGCTAGSKALLTWNGDLVDPPDVPTAEPPAGASPAQLAAIAGARHRLAVPTWIAGYVLAGEVKSVRISFTNGTTVSPEITWISPPINAGFFAYDVPSHLRLHADHVTEVEALNADGAVVASQSSH